MYVFVCVCACVYHNYSIDMERYYAATLYSPTIPNCKSKTNSKNGLKNSNEQNFYLSYRRKHIAKQHLENHFFYILIFVGNEYPTVPNSP